METESLTVLVPKPRVTSFFDRATTGFPPDLLNRVANRFQALAWLYAFTFFMAAFFPSLVVPTQRRLLFSALSSWLPSALFISMAVVVALVVRTGRLRPAAVTTLALVFEVVSSFGIAMAEFVHPRALMADSSWVGLSWVSAWVLLFNVAVPTVPR